MKVLMLKTGEKAEYNDSYGTRLIEQGKAVLCKEEPAGEPLMAEPIPEEDTEWQKKQETETKFKGGRSRKGE